MPVTPSTPTSPQSAELQTDVLVTYSDLTPFNGYLWMGIILPTAAGKYVQPTLWNSFRYQQLPQYIQVPIIAGQLDQTTQVFWNSNMEPPGTHYVWYWFDAEGNQIYPPSGTAASFAINTTPYVITVPVSNLIKPTYSGAATPIPES